MRVLRWSVLAVALLAVSLPAGATEKNPGAGNAEIDSIGMPTLGGRQFWGDVYAHAGWRIQENVITGHYRLLDPSNARHTWGTYEECREKFEKLAATSDLNWKNDHLIVMIHGLGRTKSAFANLKEVMAKEGYATLAISYPSTRGSAADHGKRLNRLIGDLNGIDKVSFVTHSFGGLVLRDALSEKSEWRHRVAVNAAVMLAPPSQGSAIADYLEDFVPFRLVGGKGGQAVTSEEASKLSVPTIPFGVIAGGRGDGEGFNPLLEGDDDGVVTVEETKLRGAADFMVVDAIHTFIMDNPKAVQAIKTFFIHKKFSAPTSAGRAEARDQ